MKNYEARKMDELGRIVIPRTLREEIGAVTGDAFEVSLEGGKIVLTPLSVHCKLCGAQEDPVEINGQTICRSCIEHIKQH